MLLIIQQEEPSLFTSIRDTEIWKLGQREESGSTEILLFARQGTPHPLPGSTFVLGQRGIRISRTDCESDLEVTWCSLPSLLALPAHVWGDAGDPASLHVYCPKPVGCELSEFCFRFVFNSGITSVSPCWKLLALVSECDFDQV